MIILDSPVKRDGQVRFRLCHTLRLLSAFDLTYTFPVRLNLKQHFSFREMNMKRRAFLQSSGPVAFGALASFSLPGAPDPEPAVNPAIRKVHLIFKTHLDVGYTDLAARVLQIYLEEFIPGALALSENQQSKSPAQRYVWTTGSWLIDQFLEKADAPMRKRMEKAIESGDIVWHGLPFTLHSELADPSLYELGIRLAANLDRRFGKKTRAAKMTDVPGHTRGIVPVLAANGIELLHIGVNSASMPPEVPPLFVWRAPDGTDLLVMYQKEYGSQMVLPGLPVVVAICFTNDNHGPHRPEQVSEIYANLHRQYPNAQVFGSSLNAVATELAAIRKQLPVVTRELGDTWIHGVASDPLKVAQFREISRLRLRWLNEKTLTFGDAADLAFGIPLLTVAEHTWGLDVKTSLADYHIYKPADFQAARSKPNFKRMEQSWQEKREYIRASMARLPKEKAEEARRQLESLRPAPPDPKGYAPLARPDARIDTPFFDLQLDPATGAVHSLRDKSSEFDWASAQNPMCLFAYQTFSKPDFDRFQSQYLTNRFAWALDDFGKTGQEVGQAASATWLPSLLQGWHKKDSGGVRLLLELAVKDKAGKSPGGCPARVTIELFFPAGRKEAEITLQWFSKPAFRLPEASWFSFVPAVADGAWILDKMGQSVDTRDVVRNGNRKLHGIRSGVRLESKAGPFSIQSLDAPLVAPGERTLLQFDNRLPETKEGVHFCLHNNIWGTNFVMWFEDDMKFRFVLKC